MTAGGEIEFVAVPRADDVALFAEAQPRALLVGREHFLDLIEDLALANRPAGMRTDVLVGQHFAAGAEDADFKLFHRENPIIAIGDIGQLAYRDFVHPTLQPFTRFPAGDETRSPRRTCSGRRRGSCRRPSPPSRSRSPCLARTARRRGRAVPPWRHRPS